MPKTTLIVLIAVLVIAVAVGALYYSSHQAPSPPSTTTTATKTTTTAAQNTTSAPGQTTVIYASLSEMTTADPSTEFSNSVMWLPLVYEPLIWYNPFNDTIIPGLALSYNVSSDGLTWTFHLRKNAIFHDGTPVTAYAVKDSIERTITLGQGASYIWDSVESIEATDNYTVVFHLKYAAPLEKIASSPYASYIFSPKVVQYAGASNLTDPKIADWFNSGHDAGSGPYILVKWDPQNEIVLKKNKDWWGWKEQNYPLANPKAPDIFIIKIIKDSTTQSTLLRSGDIDIAEYVPPESVASFKSDPNFVVVTQPSFQNLVLLLNTQKPPLDNVLVRRAIAHAIPYDDIVNIARQGFARVASGVIPYGLWGHSEDFKYQYNLTLAKQLLAQAGYPNGIPTRLVLTYTAGDIYEQRTSDLIRTSLAQIGINVDVKPMSWEEQWGLAQQGWQNHNTTQDLFMMYWWPDMLSPITYLYNLFDNESTAFDLCYYANPTFNNLIMEAFRLEATNPDKAYQLYYQAQKILYDDVPGIGLWDMIDFRVARSSVGNLANAMNPAYPTVIFAQALSVGK
ncbi:MAG: ABC transporter substrate-binding protein [Fervidicoccaceae archaeon]